MSELIDNNGTTDVLITIAAPLSDIEQVIPIIAAKLGYASTGGAVSEVEFVAEATKQWWFDFYKAYLMEQKEALAAQAAAAKRAEIEAILANNPLLGA